MRLFRPGFLAGWLYPEALFRMKSAEKVLYLTFDDGPDPGSTLHLLSILKAYGIKALFFCNGLAAEKFPDLIKNLREEGHLIGNHGYSHFDGWRTHTKEYITDVNRASHFTSDKIFRPPFGRMKLNQYSILKKKFQIVFWDLMAYDFDIRFDKAKSLAMLKNKIRPGSIIVLHDKISSCANAFVEEFIIFAKNEGYRFELLDVAGNI